MATEDKKSLERRLLDYVYRPNTLASVVASERPDFIVSLAHSPSSFFGVEVTRFFSSETNARLHRIPNYVEELLDGGRFRHKNDITTLKVGPVTILTKDGDVVDTVEGIFQEGTSLAESAERIRQLVSSKSRNYPVLSERLTHVDLVIEDTQRTFHRIERSRFFDLVISESLQVAIEQSSFREIYLLTAFNKKLGYIPLKLSVQLAELYRFDASWPEVAENAPDRSTDSELLVWAHLLQERVAEPVLYCLGCGPEVIYGDCGLLIRNSAPVVHKYFGSEFPHEAVAVRDLPRPDAPYSQIREGMAKARRDASFTLDLWMEVTESP